MADAGAFWRESGRQHPRLLTGRDWSLALERDVGTGSGVGTDGRADGGLRPTHAQAPAAPQQCCCSVVLRHLACGRLGPCALSSPGRCLTVPRWLVQANLVPECSRCIFLGLAGQLRLEQPRHTGTHAGPTPGAPRAALLLQRFVGSVPGLGAAHALRWPLQVFSGTGLDTGLLGPFQ